MTEIKTPIVMSVGGSLIVPDDIDTTFITHLRDILTHEIEQSDRRFAIIVGGGKTYRRYRDAAASVVTATNDELDALGITTCALNAHLLRLALKELGENVSVNADTEFFAPGASSDRVAVRTAVKHGTDRLINFSDTDYVYTADPNTDPNAEAITDITWADFRALIPAEWDSGMSSPFDPVAAREASDAEIEVAAINGSNLTELAKYLAGEPFIGTRIHPAKAS